MLLESNLKRSNLLTSCLKFEPSKDSPVPSNNIGLQSDIKPKKKISRKRGEDGDAKNGNMDQDPVAKPGRSSRMTSETDSVYIKLLKPSCCFFEA